MQLQEEEQRREKAREQARQNQMATGRIFQVEKYTSRKGHEVEQENIIGQGSFADVYKGKWCDQVVALKVLRLRSEEGDKKEKFMEEVYFMQGYDQETDTMLYGSELSHPNIVNLLDVCDEPTMVIVCEFAKRGSLQHLIRDKRPGAYNLYTGIKVTKDAACGLAYLHSLDPKLMHRDIKAANILCQEDYTGKVADFGESMFLKPGVELHSVGTVAWMAPEVLKGEFYNEKCDVFSLGSVIFEVVSKRTPFSKRDPPLQSMALAGRIMEGERADFPDTFEGKALPLSLYQVAMDCWEGDYTHRLPASEVAVRLEQVLKEMTTGDYVEFDPEKHGRTHFAALNATTAIQKVLPEPGDSDSDSDEEGGGGDLFGGSFAIAPGTDLSNATGAVSPVGNGNGVLPEDAVVDRPVAGSARLTSFKDMSIAPLAHHDSELAKLDLGGDGQMDWGGLEQGGAANRKGSVFAEGVADMSKMAQSIRQTQELMGNALDDVLMKSERVLQAQDAVQSINIQPGEDASALPAMAPFPALAESGGGLEAKAESGGECFGMQFQRNLAKFHTFVSFHFISLA